LPFFLARPAATLVADAAIFGVPGGNPLSRKRGAQMTGTIQVVLQRPSIAEERWLLLSIANSVELILMAAPMARSGARSVK